MEKFISRCLDSVTSENVPDTLEVIVINDGSTDSTLSIAKEYECRRPDIIKIIDKENGHYGSCVNAAMRIATGKYFRMVDADDWVDTGVLVEFLHKLSNSDADLVVTVRTECTEKENVIEYHSHELTNVTFDKTLPASEIDFKELCGSDLNKLGMHNMTYKLEVLRKSETHLDEKIPYTDVQYCSQPIAYTKTIVFLDLKLYLYYIGRTGQSVSPENYKIGLRPHIQITKNLLDRYEATSGCSDANRGSQEYFLNYVLNGLFKCLRYSDISRKEYDMAEKIWDFAIQHKTSLIRKKYFLPYRLFRNYNCFAICLKVWHICHLHKKNK